MCAYKCGQTHSNNVYANIHKPPVHAHTLRCSNPGGVVQLVMWPMVFYMVWSFFYFGTIFVFAAERIKRRGYTTLFSYVTT